MSAREWELKCLSCGRTSTATQQPPARGLRCLEPGCKGTRFIDGQEEQPSQVALLTTALPAATGTREFSSAAVGKPEDRSNTVLPAASIATSRRVTLPATAAARRFMDAARDLVADQERQRDRADGDMRAASQRKVAAASVARVLEEVLAVFVLPEGAPPPRDPRREPGEPVGEGCVDCGRKWGEPNKFGKPLVPSKSGGQGTLCRSCHQKRYPRRQS